MATSNEPHASGPGEAGLPWEQKQSFRNRFKEQAASSYLVLSFGMGVIALMLPILLLLTGGYAEHYSISYFYHVSDLCRNILVGSLCATGAFLILFHGPSKWENWLLNIAGAAAVSVALNPMLPDQCGRKDALFSFHGASAVLFFLCLAIVAVVLSKKRIKYIIWPPKKRRYKAAYNLAGALMIAMPATVFAIHLFVRRECENHWIFWVECFGIWAFAFYWFVKTHEYRTLLGIRFSTEQGHRRPDVSG